MCYCKLRLFVARAVPPRRIKNYYKRRLLSATSKFVTRGGGNTCNKQFFCNATLLRGKLHKKVARIYTWRLQDGHMTF